MGIAPRNDPPIVFWLLLALVVLLPLPLGAVYQWAWASMACVVGVLLGVWGARVAGGLQDPAIGLRTVWPLAVPFAFAVVWIGLQAQSFTPDRWHHPLWSTAAAALGGDVAGAISLDPFDTLSGLVRLLAYAGIFWLSLQYCRRAAHARQVLLAVAYAGGVYALYGLVVYLAGSPTILIFRKTVYLDDVTSTFVNRNSWATYAGLALVCASGLILALITQGAGTAASLKRRVVRTLELAVARGWPLLLTWVVLLPALVLAHSRGGFFSSVIGLLVLLLGAGMTRAVGRKVLLAFAAVCGTVIAGVFLTGGQPLLMRLLQTSLTLEERPLVYERTMVAIGDSGALGTGFGTFEDAFRFYRSSDINGHFNMAHNSYLENALELGLPAAVALFAVFAGFLVLCAMGIRRRRRDAVYPCVGFAATALVAVHASIDFSLQIPAVTATYMLIMGAACAQCWSSRHPPDPW